MSRSFITEKKDGKAGPIVLADDFEGARRVAKIMFGDAVEVVGQAPKDDDEDIIKALQESCDTLDRLFGEEAYVKVRGQKTTEG